MEQINAENLYEYSGEVKPRGNDSLSSLTLLTFIGSGYQLLAHGTRIFNGGNCDEKVAQVNSAFEQAMERQNTAGAEEFMTKMGTFLEQFTMVGCKNSVLLGAVAIIGAIGCIIGALQMRKRNKVGLPIYIASVLIYPIVTGIVFSGIQFSSFIWLWMLLAPIIFILLYLGQRNKLA